MYIDLVRHGQSEGNLNRIIQGQDDHLLTDLGRQQAMDLGNTISTQYDGVYSSPLSRAYETARIALQEANLDVEIKTLDELMEMNFGDLQGQLFREDDEGIRETFRRGRSDPSFRFEGGESGLEFVARIKRAFNTIIENSSNSDKVLVVTHGGVIQVFTKIFLGTDEKVVGNASITHIEYADGNFNKI